MNLKQSIPLMSPPSGWDSWPPRSAHDMSGKKSTTAEIKTVQVVVAKGPIGPGTAPPTPELLDVTQIPGTAMPAGTVTSSEESSVASALGADL